ncbi:VCBS domain-containing protein, partial [Parashewanella spongiae]
TLADNATVNGLTEGEEHIEVFTVTLSDDSTTTVTITINGTNDAPHAEADTVEMKESDIAYNTAYVVDSRGNLALVNLSTGAHTKIADTGTIFTDVAISQSGELFGINFNSLYTIDKLSGEVTPINEELDVRANALTFSDDGRLYAAAGDAIYELDPTDGSVLHAYDNLGVFSAGDLAFHNGKMYWTTYDGALYEVVINETTGKATVNEVISDLGLTTGNYGLVSGHDGNLYVFSGNTILLVDPINGTSEVVVIYDGIGSVFGTTIPAAVNNEATGNVLDNDTDIDNNHNSLTVTRVEFNGVTYNVGDEISGTYGFLQLQSNGEFTYRLDESREVTQDLAEGELAYDVFTYTVSDGSGGSDTATLTIKITGTDADADTGSPASEPTLSLEAGSLLASLNFEGVVTNRSISNDQNVQVSVLNDMFTGNWGSNNQYGTVEIGKASTYLNEDASKDHGDVLELENREGDNTLFLDVVLDASKFYSLNFEAAARQDTTASNSNFTVKLQKVNDDGELTGEVITLRDINFSSVNKWLEIQEFFKVEASGKYRITFEGDDADSHGALLDNIEFSESINEGIENTDIKLSNINAALNDNDGSETMIVTLSGLPEGAILKGLNNGEKVEVKVGPNGTVDVSEWDLNSLSIRVDHVGNFDVVVTVTSVESGQFQNSVSKTIELAVLYDTELYPPLSANTYSIISNMSDGSTIDIPEEWLMYSDTVTDSAHVTEAVNGVVSVDLIDNGSFAYSIHDGRTESDTDVAIVLSNELTGNENNDVIIANPDGGNVTIKGKQGNDVVVGGNGDDNINGNIGDDLIIGGRGDDFLKGGGQKTFDTFVWQAGDADGGKDQIEDFEFDFDTLDLSDLLQGEDLNTIENFLSISFVDGSTFINIDVDGQGDYTDQQIELINRDLFNKKTLTEAQVLQNLLGENGDGPLIIDTENSFNSANSAIQTSGSSEDELRITLSVDGNHIP